MHSSIKLSSLVTAALLAVTSAAFGQGAGAGAGAGGGSAGGPTPGSEAAINPSGPVTPSGGTAAGGAVGQTSPSARRATTAADMTPSQKAAQRDKRVGAVMGSGTPSGVQPTDGTSPGLPHDQQGHVMNRKSSMSAGNANAAPPGMTANSTVTQTPGSSPSTDAATADKGPVMGSGNGPSGVAPPAHTSKSKMPTP